MTNIPNKPKTTGTRLAFEKFPINKTAAITIKIMPINNTIFWIIILHMLISPRTLYRLSLERLSLYTDRFAQFILPRASNYLPPIFLIRFTALQFFCSPRRIIPRYSWCNSLQVAFVLSQDSNRCTFEQTSSAISQGLHLISGTAILYVRKQLIVMTNHWYTSYFP